MKPKVGFYEKYIKRLLDVLLSALAMVILSPVLLIVAVLVRINLGIPIVFKQPRPGKDERIFNLYKFRTMTDERDADGKLLPDEMRLTPFGKWLRSTSLDELPELWCILKGDMSIVGPRPLLVEYLPYFEEEERMRHSVRPGLTGLAQIRGRNDLTWEQKFTFDLEYVRNISFLTDIRIMWVTVKKVICRDGVHTNTQNIEGNLAEIRKERIEDNV